MHARPPRCSTARPAPRTAGESLGVGHYGLSSPSLEEVFLRVTTDAPSSTAASDDPALPSSAIPDAARGGTGPTAAAAASSTRGRSDALGSGMERGGGAEAEPPGALRRLRPAAASASASELHGDHSGGDFHAVDIGGNGDAKDWRPPEPVPASAAPHGGCSAATAGGAPGSEAPLAPGGTRRCVRPVLDSGCYTPYFKPVHAWSPRHAARSTANLDRYFHASCLCSVCASKSRTQVPMYHPRCPVSATNIFLRCCRCGVARRHVRHFKEMVRKRALAAGRDVRGAVFTLLLPVLAVAAVLVRCSCCCPCPFVPASACKISGKS